MRFLSNLWPLVWKSDYVYMRWDRNSWRTACEEEHRSHGRHIREYREFRAHVEKYASHALQKRDEKGNFIKGKW